jgi:DNA-binding SARP family transcriptional activator
MSVHFERRKSLALLSYLAVADKPVRREFLASLLWPDLERQNALRSLRRVLTSLRKDIGEENIIADRAVACLQHSEGLWIDVREFEEKRREFEKFEQPEDISEVQVNQAKLLTEAVELYQGDFLAGFNLGDADDFEEWKLVRRQQYLIAINEIRVRLIQLHGTLGQPKKVVEFSHRLLAVDPFNESAHRSLMKGLALAGRRPEALKQYQNLVQLLENELQVAPEPETVLLCRQIREGELVGTSSPSEVGVDVPLVRPKENLPRTATPFIGRKKELQSVNAMLNDSSCRLIMVAGPGGMGKTRLGIEAARTHVSNFKDGVYFVRSLKCLVFSQPRQVIYHFNSVLF